MNLYALKEGEPFLYLGEPTLEYVRAWLGTSSVRSGPIFLQVNRGESGRAKVLSH